MFQGLGIGFDTGDCDQARDRHVATDGQHDIDHYLIGEPRGPVGYDDAAQGADGRCANAGISRLADGYFHDEQRAASDVSSSDRSPP